MTVTGSTQMSPLIKISSMSRQMLSIDHEVVLGGRAVDVLEVDGVAVVITRCRDWGQAVWLPQEWMSLEMEVVSKA